MKIKKLEVSIAHPRPEIVAMLAALAAGVPLAPSKPDSTDAKTPAAVPVPPVLRIGEPWPGVDGVYAGVSRGRDGEPEGHLVLLNAKPDDELNWADAKAWAEGLGDGARLPTRFESALLYAHLQDEFEKDWHWTGSQYSVRGAWGQNFGGGGQFNNAKSFEARARAVRRFPL